MCANYLPGRADRMERHFGVACTPDPAALAPEVYPGHLAPMLRLQKDGAGAGSAMECVAGCFGLVPPWADRTLARKTYNARSETVAEKPSYRTAFRKSQFCIIPAEGIFEPNFESGHAVRWKIAHAQDRPLGLAGLWDWHPQAADGGPLLSFTMLTINATDHPLMRRFHKPEDEKRMVVILEPHQYQAWLQATPEEVPSFLVPYPAQWLVAEPAPRPPARRSQPDRSGQLFG